MKRTPLLNGALAFGITVAVASIGSGAFAQSVNPPWISSSAGSSARVGDTVNLLGGGFGGRSTVKLKITDPKGSASVQVVKVGADGSISYRLPLALPGSFRAEVLDDANRLITWGTVSSGPRLP